MKNQLAELNRLLPIRLLLQDIPAVGPMRTAAVYAAEWMRAPNRLALPIDPEDESSANRAAIRVILYLVSGALVGLHPDIAARWHDVTQALDLSTARRLHDAPLARWREVRAAARHYGMLDSTGACLEEFVAVAGTFGLVVVGEATTTGSPSTGRPWLPAKVTNWFGPKAIAATRPSREKRHAVVDAFFNDQYRRLDPPRPSPVRLLATFPILELVAAPEVSLPAASYERICRIRDLEWAQLFLTALAGYTEADVARTSLLSKQGDVGQHQSPAVSTIVPEVPLLQLLTDHLDAKDLSVDVVAEACLAAGVLIDAVAAVDGSGDAQVALKVLDWLGHDRPTTTLASLDAAVRALAPGHSYGLLVQLVTAIDAVLAVDGPSSR